MTNEEILKAAIVKATSNGYVNEDYVYFEENNKKVRIASLEVQARMVIFSHDFSKAFWGDNWMPRLQILVLEKDPIKYLEKFL